MHAPGFCPDCSYGVSSSDKALGFCSEACESRFGVPSSASGPVSLSPFRRLITVKLALRSIAIPYVDLVHEIHRRRCLI
jgi:hypothetical protein